MDTQDINEQEKKPHGENADGSNTIRFIGLLEFKVIANTFQIGKFE